MERRDRSFVDDKGLTVRNGRLKRPNRRSMLPICYQNPNRAGKGCPVESSPIFFFHVSLLLNVVSLRDNL